MPITTPKEQTPERRPLIDTSSFRMESGGSGLRSLGGPVPSEALPFIQYPGGICRQALTPVSSAARTLGSSSSRAWCGKSPPRSGATHAGEGQSRALANRLRFGEAIVTTDFRDSFAELARSEWV